MGYTHSCGGLAVTSQLADDARLIVDAAAARGISGRGPGGGPRPEITAERIAFGPGDDGPGELFILGAGDPKGLVKTSALPYDEVVTAILGAACVRAGLAPGSNGSFPDWPPGIVLYERACGPVPPDALQMLRRMLGREDG